MVITIFVTTILIITFQYEQKAPVKQEPFILFFSCFY